MIVVDSSVWIDFFRGVTTPQTERLDALLGSEKDFHQARRLLTALDVMTLGGKDITLQAARNYRALRAQGVTVRKTIDTIIATCCIENDVSLLYSDRDFDPFVEHLGLRSAMLNQ